MKANHAVVTLSTVRQDWNCFIKFRIIDGSSAVCVGNFIDILHWAVLGFRALRDRIPTNQSAYHFLVRLISVSVWNIIRSLTLSGQSDMLTCPMVSQGKFWMVGHLLVQRGGKALDTAAMPALSMALSIRRLMFPQPSIGRAILILCWWTVHMVSQMRGSWRSCLGTRKGQHEGSSQREVHEHICIMNMTGLNSGFDDSFTKLALPTSICMTHIGLGPHLLSALSVADVMRERQKSGRSKTSKERFGKKLQKLVRLEKFWQASSGQSLGNFRTWNETRYHR